MINSNEAKAYCHKCITIGVREFHVLRGRKCEECGVRGRFRRAGTRVRYSLVAHHEDYLKPLGVEWLCYRCHGKRHGGPVRRFRYINGVMEEAHFQKFYIEGEADRLIKELPVLLSMLKSSPKLKAALLGALGLSSASALYLDGRTEEA